MTKKEQFKTISQIADKVLEKLREWNMILPEKLQIMMDFENVNNICPLNFELLLNNEETLMHDYAGIRKYFNRQTLVFDDKCFVPRSALKE